MPSRRRRQGGRARTINDERVAGYVAACRAVGAGVSPPAPLAYRLTVCWPRGAERWDDERLLAASRGFLMGIAQFLEVNDRHLHLVEIVQRRDLIGDGATVVDVWSEADGDD